MPTIADEVIKAMQNGDKHAWTLDSTLHDTIDNVRDLAGESVIVNDRYGNSLASVGNNDVANSFTNYGFSNDTMNWTLWLALYNDSWVFRRAIDKPAQDEVNSGIILYGNSDFTEIYKDYDKYKFDLTRLLMWGALFGGSIAVMMFDNVTDDEMAQPINKDKVKNAKILKLYVTDRWYGLAPSVDNVTNMKNIDFGKPKSYQVTFADGSTHTVHHSYVIRYEHRTAPQLVKNGWLQGWGYAEGAHILNELSRDDQLKAAITSLVNKSLIEVVKMSGMRGVFMGADQENEEQLRKRLEMVNWGRTYNSLTFLDKDDDYQHFDYQLSGLSELLENNMYLISSALEMPGVLFEQMKGGISQDDNSYDKYAATILNRCETYFRPVLNKFLSVLYMMHGIEEPVDFDFKSIIQDKVNANKMDALEKCSGMLEKMINMGVISKYQAAKSLINFTKEGSIKIDFTEENLNKLKVEEEMSILETYKMAGKGETENSEMLESQFGGGGSDTGGEEIPDKVKNLIESNEETPATPEGGNENSSEGE